MRILIPLILASLLHSSHAQYITDDTILQDLSSFLGLANSYQSVEKAINNSNAPFSCNQGPITQIPGQKYDVDTGRQDCGWEIATITVACTNSRMVGLQLQLRSVVNATLMKSTSDLTNGTTRTYNVPKDVYVTKVTTGTALSLNRDFVVSLVFELSNGQSAKLVCYNPRTVNAISYNSFERINGFFGTTYLGAFTSLGFYKHSISARDTGVGKPASTLSYYELMRSDTTNTYDDVADNFLRVGPFGQKTGKFFEDPYLYGHWNITKMSLAASKNALLSLQTYVVNSFFYYLQLTEIHGDTNPSVSATRDVNVPLTTCISTVEFVLDRSGCLIGLAFYFSDNSTSGYLGQAPSATSGFVASKYVVKSNQELVGFFGYQNEVQILGLGLLIVEKNDKRFYY